MQYQELLMRCNRRPDSVLTIERRHVETTAAVGNPTNGSVDDGTAVAHATLISDVIASATMAPTSTANSHVVQPQQQLQHQPPRSMAALSEPLSSELV
jgi:hypothetical protein